MSRGFRTGVRFPSDPPIKSGSIPPNRGGCSLILFVDALQSEPRVFAACTAAAKISEHFAKAPYDLSEPHKRNAGSISKKKKSRRRLFSFCTFHFSLFTLHSSLRFPLRLFRRNGKERKEKSEKRKEKRTENRNGRKLFFVLLSYSRTGLCRAR